MILGTHYLVFKDLGSPASYELPHRLSRDNCQQEWDTDLSGAAKPHPNEKNRFQKVKDFRLGSTEPIRENRFDPCNSLAYRGMTTVSFAQ